MTLAFTNGEIVDGRRLFQRDWQFVAASGSLDSLPKMHATEIAFAGRSNVGKSSLINALTARKALARTSRTPGRTRLVNWFEIEQRFHLVDLPGYGYAEVSRDMRESWRPLIEKYLESRVTLGGVVLLVDIRRGVEEEELDFVPWLEARDTPMVVALTKSDKLAKNKRMLEVTKAKHALGLKRDPFAVSAQTGDGLDALWRAVLGLVEKKRA
jgi:GTP-binding protein